MRRAVDGGTAGCDSEFSPFRDEVATYRTDCVFPLSRGARVDRTVGLTAIRKTTKMNFMESHDPMVLRGHTLLCFQGFRGEGYSPSFIANLGEIHARLFRNPGTVIRVVAQPDTVCAACPNLDLRGCALKGEASEEAMQRQDRDVLRRLEMKEGEIRPWGKILERIIDRIDPNLLPEICGSCPWLPLGYCQEGIRRLKRVEEVGP